MSPPKVEKNRMLKPKPLFKSRKGSRKRSRERMMERSRWRWRESWRERWREGSRVSKNGEWRMCVCSAQEAVILATQRKEF